MEKQGFPLPYRLREERRGVLSLKKKGEEGEQPQGGRKVKMSRRRRQGSDSDGEDDSFLYRYPMPSSSAGAPSSAPASGGRGGGGRGGGSGSGGLAPSKSTVYVSNLDFALTNSDLHTLFSRFGKVARVTVLKDRESRRSKGVAFVLFVRREDAVAAAAEMHGKVLNGRTLAASIAEDNGRTAQFIRRREYRDKSHCYECGGEGHLSYECPRNQLGPRERPPPSKKSRRGGGAAGGRGGGRGSGGGEGDGPSWQSDEDDDAVAAAFEDDRWASVVDTRGEEEKAAEKEGRAKAKAARKEKRKGYFSDESDEDDD
ncbi:U11/U12 small nuclear ribonucleoprotein 31 kDa protein [Triticum aestivum]|nr:U11/U12 small nuclear ribonucleoprotein 31 kDa protein-like [Triticum aestivum]